MAEYVITISNVGIHGLVLLMYHGTNRVDIFVTTLYCCNMDVKI